MTESTTYDAYLELAPDGACLAQVLDLPGCFAIGPGEEMALAALTHALPGYFAWLQRHDDYTPAVAGPFAVIPQARVVGTSQPCAATAFFAPDAQPVSAEDLDWLLALLGWATGDLADAPHADGAVLAHVAETQVQGLDPLASATESSPALLTAQDGSLLTGFQAWTEQRLRAATPDDLARVEERDGRRWSARWALRRAIVHARWHAHSRGWHPVLPGGVA